MDITGATFNFTKKVTDEGETRTQCGKNNLGTPLISQKLKIFASFPLGEAFWSGLCPLCFCFLGAYYP